MIPRIQEKVEREIKRIRQEMHRQGTPLEFIFEGKTPDVIRFVADSYDYPLLSRRGYRLETVERKLEEPILPRYGRPDIIDSECSDVFYISGIQCCGAGDEHVPAVLNVYYGLKYMQPDVKKSVHALCKEPLKNFMVRHESSSDIRANIRAEILREIIAGGTK